VFALQADKLEREKEIAKMEIDQRAQAAKQGEDEAMNRVVVRAGLQEEMAGREYERTLQAERERAIIDVQKQEAMYSAEQRQAQQKIADAASHLERARGKGVSEEQYHQYKDYLTQQALGLAKPQVGPMQDKPPSPQELPFREPESGAIMSPNGSGGLTRLVEFEKTPEGIQLKAKLEAEKAKRDREYDLLEQLTAPNPLSGKAPDLSTPEARMEIHAQMKGMQTLIEERDLINQGAAAPEPEPPAAAPEQLGPDVGRLGQKIGEADWVGAIEEMTGKAMPNWMKKYPPKVAQAHAIHDALKEQYGSLSDVPEHLIPQVREILNEIENYHAQKRRRR
jgi:hypothetical protein